MQQAAHSPAEVRVRGHLAQDALQVTAIDPVRRDGGSLEFRKAKGAARHLAQAASHEVRAPTDKLKELLELPDIAQWASVPGVEIRYVLLRKVL